MPSQSRKTTAATTLYLDAVTSHDAQCVARWRNQHREGLRSPRLTTVYQQQRFLERLESDDRMAYWAVRSDKKSSFSEGIAVFDPHAMVGLYPIQWENGLAEISLITSGEKTRQGVGSACVALVLAEGFGNMGLETIVGECYHCNPARGFWDRIVEIYGGHSVVVPRRKRWQGTLWDATIFTLTREGWESAQ